MNDLDLRTALHRDADLAGEPSADLLDQLLRRRDDQRRRRAGALGGIAAVVVLAAGIPIGASVLTASDGGPAAPATTPTAEVVPSEVPPTTAAPEPKVEVVPPPVAPSDAPVTEPEQPATVEAVACPDVATLDAAMPADTSERRYTIDEGTPVCSGTWATVPITEHTVWQGEWTGDGAAATFRHVDGAWTMLSTTNGDRSIACDDPAIPALIWERGCAVD